MNSTVHAQQFQKGTNARVYPVDAFVHNHVSGNTFRIRPGSFKLLLLLLDVVVVNDGTVVVTNIGKGKPPIKNPCE